MYRFATIALTFAFVLGCASFVSGCKSDDEKFCTKLKELDADKFDDCEDDALPEVKEMCGDNFGEAVSCIEGTDSMDDAEKCVKEHCAK